jgi:hypothetical protein
MLEKLDPAMARDEAGIDHRDGQSDRRPDSAAWVRSWQIAYARAMRKAGAT